MTRDYALYNRKSFISYFRTAGRIFFRTVKFILCTLRVLSFVVC